jgi:hypothetical protein
MNVFSSVFAANAWYLPVYELIVDTDILTRNMFLLHCFETLSVTLRKDYRLRLFENKTCGHNRD